MRRFLYLFSAVIFLLPGLTNAQETGYYIPLNFEKAFENGTRSRDGKPGERYWQNRSDYDIKAQFIPSRRLIRGAEDIKYQNNSPDTLKELVVRLYQDMYKKGTMRDYVVDPGDLHDGVDLVAMSVGDDRIILDNNEPAVRRIATNLIVQLPTPIAPGEKTGIQITWNVQLPRVTPIRTGAYSDSAFLVAYWYPMISVYDDIDGWDKTVYSGTQEFYSDFGDYDVELTVPRDYLIWATGELQNGDKVLSPALATRLKKAADSDSVQRIVDSSDSLLKGKWTTGRTTNTWNFAAKYVPDFAFAASNYYNWDAVSIQADPQSDKRVLIQAVYPPDSPDFNLVAAIAWKVISEYSQFLPGVPYPYPSMTAFNRPGEGGGGMEYPMMINDGSNTKELRTLGLTAHEIAHTYFPFFMGINERKYAWMDEGWATMLTDELQSHYEPATDPFGETVKTYLKSAGGENDLPMMIPSTEMRSAYRVASYSRPAVAYKLLMDFMGGDRFKKALQTYIRRWNGKHPTPFDFFYTFDQEAGENLAWFWSPWFFERGYPDLAIKNIQQKDNKQYLVVDRIGDFPVPVYARVFYRDNGDEIVQEPISVWKDGRKDIEIPLKYNIPVRHVDLGLPDIPDLNTDNNSYDSGIQNPATSSPK
jgi:hypothetical protein